MLAISSHHKIWGMCTSVLLAVAFAPYLIFDTIATVILPSTALIQRMIISITPSEEDVVAVSQGLGLESSDLFIQSKMILLHAQSTLHQQIAWYHSSWGYGLDINANTVSRRLHVGGSDRVFIAIEGHEYRAWGVRVFYSSTKLTSLQMNKILLEPIGWLTTWCIRILHTISLLENWRWWAGKNGQGVRFTVKPHDERWWTAIPMENNSSHWFKIRFSDL